MSRLSILLDGKPAYLYRFTQSSYENKRQYLYAHRDCMTSHAVARLVASVVNQLPDKIENNFLSSEIPPDLFERAIESAGFVPIDDEILLGLWLPRLSEYVIEREQLERVLGEEIGSK